MAHWQKKWLITLILLGITPTVLNSFGNFLKYQVAPNANFNVPSMAMSVISVLVLGLVIAIISRRWQWVTVPIHWLTRGFMWLWWQVFPNPNEAQFMPPLRRFMFHNGWYQGFVTDGVHQISRKKSFQNVMVVGGVGTGKTTTQAIPSLLKMDNCSMVVTDLSGELLQATGHDLERRGFEVVVLNLMDINRGCFYNPLALLKTPTDIAQAAHILVKSSSAMRDSKDPFWNAGAERILRILMSCMLNAKQPQYMNLANLKFLLSRFDGHINANGAIGQFVSQNGDTETFDDYMGFINGNEKTTASFISTASNALASLNPDLAKMTATNEIDLHRLRTYKTALFIQINQQDMSYYEFIINLFFADLINVLLSNLAAVKKALPVMMIIDEFAQLEIDRFEVFATTARKYNVGFMILIQALSQLSARYGDKNAETIKGSLSTKIYYPGQNIDISAQLSRRMGQRQKFDLWGKPSKSEPLMNESQISNLLSTLGDRALLLSGSNDPIKLWLTPYFNRRELHKRTKKGAYPLPFKDLPEIDYINLSQSQSPLYSGLDNDIQ